MTACRLLRGSGTRWYCACGQWETHGTSDDVARPAPRYVKLAWHEHKRDESQHEEDDIRRRIYNYQWDMKGCTKCGHEDHISAECPTRLAEKNL